MTPLPDTKLTVGWNVLSVDRMFVMPPLKVLVNALKSLAKVASIPLMAVFIALNACVKALLNV